MKRFRKIAQAPPLPAPPAPAGGAPMGALPPLPSPVSTPMGGPMGAPSVQPMSSPPDRPEITAALDTLGKILYDADVTEQIENNSATSADDLALDVWLQYGGKEDGSVDDGKIGQRSDEAIPAPQAEKELDATKDSRWERLPQGQSIAQITSLEEITKLMPSLMAEVAKSSKAKDQGAGGAPPGMPPGLAKTFGVIRLANVLDKHGYMYDSDFIDRFLVK